MSNTLDSAKLSDIIHSATQEMVSRTEAFIKSVKDDPVGSDTITVMLNGTETVLSRENYNLLKAQNDETKTRMKADLKAIAAQFKTNLKKES
ncbi:MAG TPA: hypothetical protein DC001_02940 [Clostridiales bacterium]|jgi:hypothetical protein|nr:hypothetical protein [Clostridiales bacterium]HBR09181.1 hypothetical protein [Clostridiales bacterium]